jgi:hypothetical protein
VILMLNLPNNVKQLRLFLVTVHYYRDMWAKCRKMLAPLTHFVGECKKIKATTKNGTNKKSWRWDAIQQQTFDNLKATIAKDMVLAYPDFTKPFKIYTDASTMQLGVVITQENRPIMFFSRKLNKVQSIYSFTKIELLALAETLKESLGMLWGQPIKVYTDQKLSHKMHQALTLIADRVVHWRLLSKEFTY